MSMCQVGVGALSKYVGLGLITLPAYKAKGSELRPGEFLDRGEALVSGNGGVLFMQPQGNLVLYGPDASRKQFTALWWSAAHNTPAVRATMSPTGSLVLTDPQGRQVWEVHPTSPAVRIAFQTDGNLVWYDKNNKAVLSSMTNGWHINPNLKPSDSIFAAIEKIPVVGDAAKIVAEASAAPFKMAAAIASGERLDHVALGALKDQLKIVKDVAPYATTVVSFVPGIGTGVAMAIGAGAALAEGQSITAAAKAAIRDAIPGGPLVQAGFDAAMKVASGENIGKIALEEARSQLPATAQKAFDIGLAVVTGEKLQNALANGLASIAPGQLQTVLAAGEKALASTPGLSDAFKNIAPGAAQEGFHLAAGLLSHAGINEKALTAARSQLPPEVVQGFDAALKTQIPHTAWLANVVAAPAAGTDSRPLEPPKHAAAAPAPVRVAAAPRPLEPPKRAAHYAPYPKTGLSEGPPTSEVQSPTHTATEVRSPTSTSTEVRSPTSTSTEAYTQGNFTVTVTDGAGAGATNVDIQAPPMNRENVANSKGAPKNAQENQNINAPRPRSPTAQENSSVNAPRAGALSGPAYAPYPKMGALSGPPPDCHSLGAPIANMPHGMRQAGLSAVNGTGGRSRMVHGPDGNDYLFALEGGALVARQCHQKGTGVSGAPAYAPYPRA